MRFPEFLPYLLVQTFSSTLSSFASMQAFKSLSAASANFLLSSSVLSSGYCGSGTGSSTGGGMGSPLSLLRSVMNWGQALGMLPPFTTTFWMNSSMASYEALTLSSRLFSQICSLSCQLSLYCSSLTSLPLFALYSLKRVDFLSTTSSQHFCSFLFKLVISSLLYLGPSRVSAMMVVIVSMGVFSPMTVSINFQSKSCSTSWLYSISFSCLWKQGSTFQTMCSTNLCLASNFSVSSSTKLYSRERIFLSATSHSSQGSLLLKKTSMSSIFWLLYSLSLREAGARPWYLTILKALRKSGQLAMIPWQTSFLMCLMELSLSSPQRLKLSTHSMVSLEFLARSSMSFRILVMSSFTLNSRLFSQSLICAYAFSSPFLQNSELQYFSFCLLVRSSRRATMLDSGFSSSSLQIAWAVTSLNLRVMRQLEMDSVSLRFSSTISLPPYFLSSLKVLQLQRMLRNLFLKAMSDAKFEVVSTGSIPPQAMIFSATPSSLSLQNFDTKTSMSCFRYSVFDWAKAISPFPSISLFRSNSKLVNSSWMPVFSRCLVGSPNPSNLPTKSSLKREMNALSGPEPISRTSSASPSMLRSLW